jgi:hypothetical protein
MHVALGPLIVIKRLNIVPRYDAVVSNQRRSKMTSKLAMLFGAVALTALFATASDSAFAAKKVSYEQAWKRCKALLDKEMPSTAENQNERYLRGGACLKKYGYGF